MLSDNLEIIERRFPKVFDRLQVLSGPSKPKQGSPAKASADPLPPAWLEGWVGALPIRSHSMVYGLTGLGDGQLAQALLDRLDPLSALVVAEPNLERLYALVEQKDLRTLLEDDRFFLIAGECDSDAFLVMAQIHYQGLGGFEPCIWGPLYDESQSYY
ncbi:MAG TPA: hypothetical protein PLV25_07995, partial [Opitutales bacterium]|nr:hypothetical protein [Opitutales bacterium]